jgi:foldase protein PrsA
VNKSKKPIKKPKTKQAPVAKRKYWLIPTIILGVLLVAALLFDQLYERVLLKIDDEKYHLSDLTYYFYDVESGYNTYSQLFGPINWNTPYDDSGSVTLGDLAKQEAMGIAIFNEIMYKEALAAGYSLNEEEIETINNDIANILYDGGLSADVIEDNGFTGDYLKKVKEKVTLAKRYREDIIDTLDVDDEGIKAGISYEDNRQYDIEYLFISAKKTDESGNQVDKTEEEMKAAYAKIEAKYQEALNTEDWSTLVPEDEKELQYMKNDFIKTDTTYPEDLKAMMMGMENGEISALTSAETGYYIIRMINNDNPETYNTMVENAIKEAEDAAFETYYGDNILSKYDIKMNERAIKNVKMGSFTSSY